MATETPQLLALSSVLSATKLAQAINSASEPSVKAALCRAQVHSQFPTLAWNDHLGVLCRMLGYDESEAGRLAFIKAECHAPHHPGLCRACYYLHPSVDMQATSLQCSQCRSLAVTSGKALAEDLGYSL